LRAFQVARTVGNISATVRWVHESALEGSTRNGILSAAKSTRSRPQTRGSKVGIPSAIEDDGTLHWYAG
jgi:hypothetical protein